jgi:pimeloyl-ACP methyl ester carboxylesterase/class 3 adenylate cyclase
VAIAYAIAGSGPADLVYLAPLSNLDLVWENPHYARFLRKLASFSRLIRIDRRGTGVSDRYSPDDLPTLEELVDDLDAVLDAAGSQRAALFGYSDAGALCAMYGATRPDRVTGLILHATAARGRQAPDYPWQWSDEEWEQYLRQLRDPKSGFGTRAYAEETLPLFAPSHRSDERLVEWWERFQRHSASPSAVYAQEVVFQRMDIRGMLPSIAVPTLILHRRDDAVEPAGAGRYLRDAIADAEYVELPGADHFPWAGDQDSLLTAVQHFFDRVRMDEDDTFERVLATVLFTDIVDSTAQAATMGDRRWREVCDQHDRLVRAQLARYRGREIRKMGDGFLAVFDGPARAVQCASAICESTERLGIELRAGLHTGEIQSDGDDIAGIAVAIGARIGAIAGAGEVLVSSTVKDLVIGSRLAFEDRGSHRLKGVPDAWHLYALRRDYGPPSHGAGILTAAR